MLALKSLHRNTYLCVGGLQNMDERPLVNMTITVTKKERKALKQAALDNDISVSALIRKWLEQYQKDKGDKNNG